MPTIYANYKPAYDPGLPRHVAEPL